MTTNNILDANVTQDKIAPGADGEVLTTTAGTTVWAAPTAGAVTADGTTITGDGNATDLSVATEGITTTQILDGTIATDDIADDAVTTIKILDDNVTPDKIQQGADGQVLLTNGTAVEWENLSNPANTGSILFSDGNGGITENNAQLIWNNITLRLGVGIADPTRKLHVAGDLQVDTGIWIGASQITPDYVFQKYFTNQSSLNPNYNFTNLEELEKFIKENHHLPGVKSAKQVKEEGVWNLSESNIKNLEKIEELFLHTIEQEKKIEELQSKNISLSEELESLKKDISDIKEFLQQKKNE